MGKADFFAALKSDFYPRLRAAGFQGSGQNFCRSRGEVLHAVNVQGNRYGGSCAVNLGIHLSFLPTAAGAAPPGLGRIREVDCEFRRRLAPEEKVHQWWDYGATAEEAERNICSLLKVYFAVGEPWFECYSSLDSIAAEFGYAAVTASAQKTVRCVVYFAPVRAALIGARIQVHKGNKEESRRLAAWGLANVGGATRLQEELTALARGE